jgi:glutamyl-tRNA reductase
VRERLICLLAEPDKLLPPYHEPSFSPVNSYEPFNAIRELIILSTCHRIEVYAGVDASIVNPRALLVDFLARAYNVAPAVFSRHSYYYAGREAVLHLFRVAAGLDSMVLGEPQILGQVTSAYMKAVKAQAAGPLLSTLFRGAIRTGKRARNETLISSNPASISAIAIALAQQIVGDLRAHQVLVIGLGEMGRLALKALQARSIKDVALVNRTRQRAEAVAAQWGGQVYGLTELPQALAIADVVISATSAPYPIISADVVRQVMAQRPDRPLVLIDIAMPRDIDPAVSELPGIHLFGIDHLRSSLDEAQMARQQEIPQVEGIIDQEVIAFEVQLRQLAMKPLITDLHQKAESIRQREVERTLRRLGDVDPQTLAHIQHLSRSLINKLLHEPTMRLKELANDGTANEAAEYTATVRHLFGLEMVAQEQE